MNDNTAAPSILGNDISASESLPQYISRAWHFPLQQHMVDGETYYSVRDWLIGLTGVSHAKVGALWYKYRPKVTVAGNVHVRQLPYLAINGATVQVAFTNDEGLYKIAMAVKATKDRIALKEIKSFLAKAGVFVDEARRDPEMAAERLAAERRMGYIRRGKSEEWIITREQGVITRKQFVSAIFALVEDKQSFGLIIGSLTNTVYKGVFADDVTGLRRRLGISPKENPRDNFSVIALSYTTIAEESVKIHLKNYSDNDYIPVPVIRAVVEAISKAIGVQVETLANGLQIDIVTGGPKGLSRPQQGQLGDILQRLTPVKPLSGANGS